MEVGVVGAEEHPHGPTEDVGGDASEASGVSAVSHWVGKHTHRLAHRKRESFLLGEDEVVRSEPDRHGFKSREPEWRVLAFDDFLHSANLVEVFAGPVDDSDGVTGAELHRVIARHAGRSGWCCGAWAVCLAHPPKSQ